MNLMIMATFIEAKPFIELMPLTGLYQGPFPAFKQGNTILLISGMGKVNAAMAATYGCMNYTPDRVFNFGAAGATSLDASPGDIYQIETVVEYDGFDFKTGMPPTFTAEILPGFRNSNIATRDIPVIDRNDRETVSLSAELTDMEASAIVQVCEKFQVPCYLFKFVTDTPEHPSQGDIKKHIRQYRFPFYQFIADSVLPVFRKINSA